MTSFASRRAATRAARSRTSRTSRFCRRDRITFTGPIGLHANDGLTVDGTYLPGVTYGFTFTGGTGFDPGSGASSHNQNFTFRGGSFANTRVVVANGNRITYDGTAATTLFSNLTIDTMKLTGHSMVYDGTWDGPTTYHNVVMGMTLSNVTVVNDASVSAMKVFGNSLYHLVADHWHVTARRSARAKATTASSRSSRATRRSGTSTGTAATATSRASGTSASARRRIRTSTTSST